MGTTATQSDLRYTVTDEVMQKITAVAGLPFKSFKNYETSTESVNGNGNMT